MMKAFKAWMSEFKTDFTAWEERGSTAHVPVLVIDASDFPADYPEIGSEWLDVEAEVVVLTHPFQDLVDRWRVVVQRTDTLQRRYDTPISNLRPIPQTATGEVVGTLTLKVVGVSDDGDLTDTPLSIEWSPKAPPVPMGTYDIIRREP